MSEKSRYALGAFVASIFINFAFYSQIFDGESTAKVIVLSLLFIGLPMAFFVYYLIAVIEQKESYILGFTFHAVYTGTSLAVHLTVILWVLAVGIG